MKKVSYIKLLLLSTTILAFNTIAIDSAEASSTGIETLNSNVSGTLAMDENSILNIVQTAEITSAGKIINKTTKARLHQGKSLEIEPGADSTVLDKSTGAIHNHGTLTLYKGSKVHGTGKIINYSGFTTDEANTTLARTNTSSDGYKKPEYKPETDLTTAEALKKAAYYDLVNGGHAITNFQLYRGGKVVGTDQELSLDTGSVPLPEQPALTSSNSRIINDSVRGDGSDDYGYVDPQVRIEIFGTPLVQKDTPQDYAYNLDSAREHIGQYTTEHNSDNKNEVKGSFFSLDGYTQYANRVTNGTGNEATDITSSSITTTVPSGATTFKFNLQNSGTKESPRYSYTPIFIPKVDDGVVIVKTTPDNEKIINYEKALMKQLDHATGGFKFTEWASDDPVTTYAGDNSWFNGVFKVDRGGVIIPNIAGMFGGRVEIGRVDSSYLTAKEFHQALNSSNTTVRNKALEFAQASKPTEFEWQGGAKDEYNRPDIYMNGNASLYFNLQGTPIFSLYGNITGSEKDRLIFQNGTIYIKGDLSGFRGRIAVTQGAKFEVRSSDAGSSSTYQGKFPNADIYQIDAEGNLVTTPEQETVIDTGGMENVKVNNGHISLKNSEGTVSLKQSTIEQGAMVTIEGDSEISDVTISGLAVTKGDMRATSVTLSGGVFAVEGSVTTENMTAGSTIALWGNNVIDRNVSIGGQVGGGTFTITDGHTLKLYNDFDLSSGKADQIDTTDNTVVNSGNGVQIGGMNFINNPRADEYRFTILTGAASFVTPITIGAVYNGSPATFVAYQNATFTAISAMTPGAGGVGTGIVGDDTVYTYTLTSGTQLTATLNNGIGQVTINGINYYIYGSSVAGAGNILMTRLVGGYTGAVESMHLTGLGSVSSIYGLISDDYGYYKDKENAGKYSFWSKSFAESDKYNTSSSDIKSKNWGTIFGFDAKPIAISKFNAEFMPTIFGGISHRNMKFSSYKAKQDGYIFGGKGTFFNKKSSIELFASYEFLKTNSQTGSNNTKIKSHVFSVGSKFGYNFQVSKNLTLRPNFLADYSFVKTPKFNGQFAKSISTKSMHKFDLAPGINLNGEWGQWGSSLSVAYHKSLGTKAKTTMGTSQISNTDVTKPHYIEYGIGINRRSVSDRSDVSLKLSRKTNGIKGFKIAFNCGIKF